MSALPHGYPKQVSAAEFLRSFGLDVGNASWLTQSYGTGPRPSLENGGFAHEMLAKLRDTTGHYYSQALIRQGSARRANDTFESAWVFVLDDVGLPGGLTGARLDLNLIGAPFGPEPSFMVETSQANFQAGFVLEPRVTDVLKWQYFLTAMKTHQIWGPGLDGAGDRTHLYRIPTGANPKNGFRTRLYRAYAGLTYTLDELATAFGIDLSPEAIHAYVKTIPAAATTEQWTIPHLESVLAHIKNDQRFSRERWVGMAHAVQNVTLAEPEEGKRVFFAWTDTWVDAAGRKQKQDRAAVERMWDTLPGDHKAGASTLRRLAEEDNPGSYLARAAVAGPTAQFTPVEPEPEPDAKLASLFERIRKSQPTPSQHANTEDPNWLDPSGHLQGLGDLMASTVPVAPPTMIDPHTRGVVTIIAGIPGKGKSLLALQQALAVSTNRPDLIRDGLPELNFPGDVIFISNEDQLGVLLRRAKGWMQRNNVSPTAGPHRVIPLRSTLLAKKGDDVKLECERILEELVAHGEKGNDIAAIIVDTLPASVSGFKENDTDDMTQVMRFLDKLARAFWCSVIFIHHLRKTPAGEEEERSLNALRGAGVIGASIRGAILVTEPTNKEREKFGWGSSQRIVVEFVLKANDGSVGTATFYELLLEQVQVRHAVTQALVDMPTPVLVPLTPVAAVQNTVKLSEYLDKLRDFGKEVRAVKQLGPGDNSDTVQSILGVGNRQASEIVGALEGFDMIRVEEVTGYDPKAPKRSKRVVVFL